ncbi:MAG TPA: M23 family metallopeptidase [Rhizomicrobium sp.]|nr:M23 family metallopeptidase [Rhizomicrobium sp.]
MLQSSLVIGSVIGGAESVAVDGSTVSVSSDGYFAFGLNYDQTKASTVVAKFSDKETVTRTVVPVVRKYDIQKVNGLPQKFVTPPPEVEARIKRENALVYEARTRDSASVAFTKPFGWPIKGIVSGTFGNQRIDNGTPMAPHFGVDIAAAKGTPIHAPADGVVSLAESDFYLTGGTTILDHGHGVSTVYLHQDELKVKVGDVVKRGDLIGLVGMKGRATGPHLHWGMNWFQMRLDPSLSAVTPTPEKA